MGRLKPPEIGEGVLYRLSDNSGTLEVTEKSRGDVKLAHLDSNDVFLLDTEKEIFIWVGKDASDKERGSAMSTAIKFLEQEGKPQFTPIHIFREGQNITNKLWNKIMD